MVKIKRLGSKQAAVILNSSIDTNLLYTRNDIKEVIYKFLSRNTVVCQEIFNLMLKEEIFIKIGNSRSGIFYIPNKFPVYYKRIDHWYVESYKYAFKYYPHKHKFAISTKEEKHD